MFQSGTDGNSAPAAAPPEAKSGYQEVLSFVRTLIIFAIIIILIRGSVVEPYKIPSGSMKPTLQVGDHILVAKFTYGFRLPFVTRTLFQYDSPVRGDVVVFTRPDEPGTLEDESKLDIIKRVIGLPGDLVEVRGTRVFINGNVLSEPYARWEEGGVPDGNFGPEKVPDGHILMLGDNRDHSRDSRYWPYPFLEISRVKGRAFLIYWSWDGQDWLSRIGKIIR